MATGIQRPGLPPAAGVECTPGWPAAKLRGQRLRPAACLPRPTPSPPAQPRHACQPRGAGLSVWLAAHRLPRDSFEHAPGSLGTRAAAAAF